MVSCLRFPSSEFLTESFSVAHIYSATEQVDWLVRIPANVTADSGNVTGIAVNVTEGRYCAF
jgi:hypothetical protein